MKYGKREYRLPKTENRQETEKAESGQVSWVLGLFLILFLAILLYMQLQLAMYKASARYLEDALALSNCMLLLTSCISYDKLRLDENLSLFRSQRFPMKQ